MRVPLVMEINQSIPAKNPFPSSSPMCHKQIRARSISVGRIGPDSSVRRDVQVMNRDRGAARAVSRERAALTDLSEDSEDHVPTCPQRFDTSEPATEGAAVNTAMRSERCLDIPTVGEYVAGLRGEQLVGACRAEQHAGRDCRRLNRESTGAPTRD